jgi:hypothetical protein
MDVKALGILGADVAALAVVIAVHGSLGTLVGWGCG